MSTWQLITSVPQYFSSVEDSELCCAYFTAPCRCFRCKQVAEKLAGFPSDFPSVKFFKVDLEETEEVGELLDISTLPTFVFIKHGLEVHRQEGVPQQRPARKVAQALRQHLFGQATLEEAAEDFKGAGSQPVVAEQ